MSTKKIQILKDMERTYFALLPASFRNIFVGRVQSRMVRIDPRALQLRPFPKVT